MKIKKAPLSIRVIYWIVNINIISLIYITVGIVSNIYFDTHLLGNDMHKYMTVSLPAKIDFPEIGNLNMDNQDIKVKLVEVTGQLEILDSPYFIKRYIGSAILFIILVLGYLIWIFRKFIKNVKEGKTFDIKNISLLKKLAYLLVLLWFYSNLGSVIKYNLIAKHLEFNSITITDDIITNSSMLVMAIVIWVLAHIFIKGLELQQEKDLTI